MSSTWFKRLMGVVVMLEGFTTIVWADFYVIPINKKVEHVILVAKKGGDFADVKTAMGSITDASETNRYLVYVGPGVYTVTAPIHLKPWITLKGSGENATLLKGAISTNSPDTSTIILGSDRATLTELSIENTGGNTLCYGIYNNSSSPIITNVTVRASGGDNNYGIVNAYHAYPRMTNITAIATGGSYSYGIYNYSSSPNMTDITTTGAGGGTNYGIYNNESSPTMTDITATGVGGNSNFGVYNSSSDFTMTNIVATASGGSDDIGIYNSNSSPTMINVTATAVDGSHSNYGVYNNKGGGISAPKIYHSTVRGNSGAVVGDGTPKCYYTLGIVGDTYTELDTDCR